MKRSMKTKLFLKLFDSEYKKLSLTEMQEIINTAAAICKSKEQVERKARRK